MKLRSSPCATSTRGSSVSSKRTQRSSAGDQLETYSSSTKTKKPRLQQFAFRTCLICTVEVQEPELPNLESVDQQNEALDQLSTSLGFGSCRLNIRSPINYTICITCRDRLHQLTSMIDNIKILETEVNLLTEALYSDLQKSFRNADADESRNEVIQYRSNLVENQKTFVFEAKPLKNNLIERVSGWNDDDHSNYAEDNITQVQGFEDELIEEAEHDSNEIEIKMEDADAAEKQESVIEDTGATNDMLETTVHKELQVFSCGYVTPGGRSKCQMSFSSEEALHMHSKAHTLHVSLGNSKRIAEEHGIEIFKEMLKQENIMEINPSMTCPACGKASFRRFSGLIHHMFIVHRFKTYPCLYCVNRQTECSGFFGSEEDLQEHVEECHKGLGPKIVKGEPLKIQNQDHDSAGYPQSRENDEMICIICGTRNCCHEVQRSAAIAESLPNPDQNVAAYPERVENDEMMCVICGPKTNPLRTKYRTKTAHIKHMLSSHSYYVCNYKDSNGLVNCLGGFKSEVAVKHHLTVEHQLDALDVEDLKLQYLDPKYQSSQCPNCGVKGLRGETYVNHLREHGLFVCGAKNPNTIKSLCTSAFDRERDLNGHINICFFRKDERRNRPIVKSFGQNSTWCRMCKFHLRFSSRATWLDHVKKHGAFACNIYMPDKKRFCNAIYMVRPLLKCHIDTDHPNVGAGEAVGPIDNGGSTGIDVLNEQPPESIRGLPVEGSFACSNCDATFEVYDQTWVDHVMSHGAMICDAIDKGSGKPCLALFYRLETLIMHCKKQHERILEGGLHCKVCDRGCESLEIYKRHQRMHGSKRGLVCDKCGKEGKISKNTYSCICYAQFVKCDTCGKEFLDIFKLRKHVRVEHEGFRHTCKLCGKQYRSRGCLEHHSLKEHGEGVPSAFECSVCKMKFASVGPRDSHFRRVHGERKFKCDREGCDKAFTTGCSLRKHVNIIHENLKPFVCEICGSAFKSASVLRNHMKKHQIGQGVKIVEEVPQPSAPSTSETNAVSTEHVVSTEIVFDFSLCE